MVSSPPRRLPPYRYRCTDKSWLTARLAATVVPWIERRLPARLPANLVTLASSLCLVAMAGLLHRPAGGRPGAVLGGIALLAAYTLLDMVDGQHARRLGASSPLGEYLDHTLDILNAAIVLAVVFWLMPVWSARGLGIALAGLNLAFAATLVEQKICGKMKLGAIGPVEGLLLIGVFLATWLAPGAETWWVHEVAVGWNRLALLVGIGTAGAVVSAALCVARLRRLPGTLTAFAAAQAVLLGALFFTDAPVPLLLAFVAWSVDFGGRVIASHLLADPLPWPDWLAPAAIVIAVALERCGVTAGVWLVWLAAGWLGLRVAIDFTGTLRVYRQFWTWWHRP